MNSSLTFLAPFSRAERRAFSNSPPPTGQAVHAPRCPQLLAARSAVRLFAFVAVSTSLVATNPVFAHGLAGKRFFPATLATEDPFVADELSLPTFGSHKLPASGEDPAARETNISVVCRNA